MNCMSSLVLESMETYIHITSFVSITQNSNVKDRRITPKEIEITLLELIKHVTFS